ncbi:MAG: hypothetical protein O9341_21480 [Paucibacter sp.]|nr:hypothetical protein [Roseateles sp.]
MKPRRPGRQETAAAVHARPLVGLLLACALCGAAAEPVVNPALAPVDMSKLLQVPSVGQGQAGASVGESARTWLPKTEFGLSGAAHGAEWSKASPAAADGLGESPNEAKPRPSAPPDARAKEQRPEAPAGAKPGPGVNRPLAIDDGMFGDALRELHDTSEFKDLKELWRDANAEVNKFRGGFLFETPTEEELAQRRSARERVDGPGGAGGYGGGAANSNYRPRTAAELERDDILLSVMIKRMFDEILPWAIGLVVGLLFLRLGYGYWRAQARQLSRTQAAGRGGAYRP